MRFLDAGETHGKCLAAIIEGLPSNLALDIEKINARLALRQGGYGRGGRMKIETDRVEILTGVRGGKTLGSPVTLLIRNRDFENWKDTMGTEESNGRRAVYVPRPGHADLTGALKYRHGDMRNVLERASARETAIRTAVGAVAQQLLSELGIETWSRTVRIGSVEDTSLVRDDDVIERVAASELRMYDGQATQEAKRLIDTAREAGESLGGVVEVVARGVVPGLGSYVQYDRKLDALLAGALMSVQAIKGVEVGLGFEAAARMGSQVHDSISYQGGFARATNRAGGIEGGMSNGEPIVVRAAMKPIPTLYKPLGSVDLRDKKPVEASVERSDICAVPACGVVCEAVVAYELARAVSEKFGSDSVEELKRNYAAYRADIESR
ncbi:MAG TPA: chorismate synthase [Candidatus Aphodoplasma excrementigallinarum]|uniref:Chorismate synthase n=1 Tax=Candidatus Aphodoplasma excrementigallinarum TaxID=2840673 RepID=A0A9D1T0B0_9FIRM|nr:chorismate synthase [Candidatus Aphodoplasma excrementigallinarum]